MHSETFIDFLKKQLLGQLTLLEVEKLQWWAAQNEGDAALYHEIFFPEKNAEGGAGTEAAYKKHLARMKKHKLL